MQRVRAHQHPHLTALAWPLALTHINLSVIIDTIIIVDGHHHDRCGLRYRKFVRAEEKRGVVIAFPAMPALAKPRKRRRPAGQSVQADGGTESVLMDTTSTTTKQDGDHAHKKKKKRKATAS